MSDVYVLDTNVYIAALRDAHQLALLKRFSMRAGLRLRLSAVVAMELRAGAITRLHAAAVDALVGLFVERGSVVTPSFEAYAQAGRVLAGVHMGERMPVASLPRSFVNDAILASSCREAGAVLVTANARDFVTIQRHLRGFRFRSPSAVFRRPP